MIDPATVFVGVPCLSAKLDALCHLGIMQALENHRFASHFLLCGQSNVALARNMLAHHFLYETDCQHFVMIDDDIGFSLKDWDYLMEGDTEAVVSEYMKKDQTRPQVARFGGGFARVSRSIFERIQNLSREDDTLQHLYRAYPEIFSVKSDQLPTLPPLMIAKRFRMFGRDMIDYYPTGVIMEGDYRGEDHGFWTLAKLVDTTLRVEKRTHLVHSGRWLYVYDAQRLEELELMESAQ